MMLVVRVISIAHFGTVGCDWWRAGEKAAILEAWRVVIGRERDDIILTSFPFQTAQITCQKTGSGSKKSKPEVKCQKGDFIHEKLPDRVFLHAGTWARTECHGGRPLFCHTTKTKQMCHGRPGLVGW